MKCTGKTVDLLAAHGGSCSLPSLNNFLISSSLLSQFLLFTLSSTPLTFFPSSFSLLHPFSPVVFAFETGPSTDEYIISTVQK
jgi:hypothetical protein